MHILREREKFEMSIPCWNFSLHPCTISERDNYDYRVGQALSHRALQFRRHRDSSVGLPTVVTCSSTENMYPSDTGSAGLIGVYMANTECLSPPTLVP